MTSKRTMAPLLSAYLIALFAQGCGGGDSTLGTPNTTGSAGTTTGTTTGGGITTGSGTTTGTTTGGGATTGGITTGSPVSPGTTGGVSATAKVYRGNATVTLDHAGGGAQQTYTTRVMVAVDRPLNYRGLVEGNPFNLTVQPETSRGAASPREGQFALYSAHVDSNASGATSSLRQCWKLEQTGSALTGTLQDNHYMISEMNTVNVPAEVSPGLFYPWASLMGNGTTLTGTMDDRNLQFTLEGRATGRGETCTFTIQVNASRS